MDDVAVINQIFTVTDRDKDGALSQVGPQPCCLATCTIGLPPWPAHLHPPTSAGGALVAAEEHQPRCRLHGGAAGAHPGGGAAGAAGVRCILCDAEAATAEPQSTESWSAAVRSCCPLHNLSPCLPPLYFPAQVGTGYSEHMDPKGLTPAGLLQLYVDGFADPHEDWGRLEAVAAEATDQDGSPGGKQARGRPGLFLLCICATNEGPGQPFLN